MITTIFMLLLKLVFFIIFFTFSLETNHFFLANKKTKNKEVNFLISLFLFLDLFFWATSKLSLMMFFIDYLFLLFFVIRFERKNLFSPFFFFLFATMYYIIINFTYEEITINSIFIGIKLFEPIVFIFLIWISEKANQEKKIIRFFVVSALFFIYILVESYFFSLNNTFKLSIAMIFISLFFYLSFQILLIFVVENLYQKFFKRQNDFKKNNYFFKPYLQDMITVDYFKNNKKEYGAVITFETITKSNLEKKYIMEFIVEKINEFYDDVLFFQTNQKSYSCLFYFKQNEINLKTIYSNNFVLKRDDKDLFNKLNIINEVIEGAEIKFYISIYGIDSSDIKFLLQKNEFLQINEQNINYKNNVIVYDEKIFYKYFFDKNLLLEFLKENVLKINYKTRSTPQKNIFLDYDFSISKQNKEKEKKINFDNETNFYFLMRYIFLNVINKFLSEEKEYDKLILNIPYLWIKENIEYFENRINGLKIEKKIIININLVNVDLTLLETKDFLKKISSLYSLSIYDFNEKYFKELLLIEPSFFTFDSFSKIENMKINDEISRERILKKQNYFK